MRKQLQQLARLQEIDDQLSMFERSKGDYPERIEELTAELATRSRDLQESDQQRKEMDKRQRHLNRQMEQASDQLAHLQQRLSGVKNNKEWDALQKEMDAAKTQIGESETALLEVMEALERLNGSGEASTEESLEEFTSRAMAEIADLKEKLGGVDAKMARIRNERDSLSTQIDDRLKRVYNRIKQGKQGTAVVPVVRDACGGCFTRIPPQTVVEVRRAERAITCENCGRILVWFDQPDES